MLVCPISRFSILGSLKDSKSFISRGGNTGSGRSRIWTDFTFDSSPRTSSPQQSPPPSSRKAAEEGAGYARSSFLVALNTPLTSCQTAVTLKCVGTVAAVAVLCPGDQLTSARNRFGKIGMLLGKDVRSVMCVSAPWRMRVRILLRQPFIPLANDAGLALMLRVIGSAQECVRIHILFLLPFKFCVKTNGRTNHLGNSTSYIRSSTAATHFRAYVREET